MGITKHISLRPITWQDKTFVHEVHDLAYKEVIERQFGPWDQETEDRFFEDIWAHPGLQIIQYNGEDCGFFCVDDRGEDLFIYEMVILPKYQGKGIGTSLLVEVQNTARKKNKYLMLEVLKENVGAQSLYKRHGFISVGKNETHLQMRWGDR